MSSQTIYLITGASRGLGFSLTKTFLTRPTTTVIAAVRDPSSASSTALTTLPKSPSSHLILVKLDSASPTDALTAASTLQDTHGVTRIDYLIANAGISGDLVPARETTLSSLEEKMTVNGWGPILLFQAFYGMLLAGEKKVFVGVGSAMGSIGGMEERWMYPGTAYGVSKAVLHWFVRKVHFEEREKGVLAFAVDPGYVQTDMGNGTAKLFGMEKAFQELDPTVEGMVKVIDGAMKETGGKNITWEGKEWPW